MLFELLSQDQFELLLPMEDNRLRLVYLMNDAVESFLIFEDAVMTGDYLPEFEGAFEAEVSQADDGRYVLWVRQNESVVTVFFSDLSLEVSLYNYGKLGHVWMKDHEDLRQIEYWIAVLKTKKDYLGEDYCNELESRLACLEEFPPLNCCCYPAVPRKYFEPREDAWIPTEEGIRVMLDLCNMADDMEMKKAVIAYWENPTPAAAKKIADILTRNMHMPLVDLIIEQVRLASSQYPDRVFDRAEEESFDRIRKKAELRKDILLSEKKPGRRVLCIYQEPFAAAKDSIEFKAHLIIREPGLFKRKVTTENFEL